MKKLVERFDDKGNLCEAISACKKHCLNGGIPSCHCDPVIKVRRKLFAYESTGFEPGEIPQWILVSERLPEAEKPVLICATRKFCDGKEAQIRSLAMYEDGKTTTDNSAFDWDNADFEYDEKSDSFLISEGWWEYPVYSESFSAVDDFVTHWMPLPAKPKEDS